MVAAGVVMGGTATAAEVAQPAASAGREAVLAELPVRPVQRPSARAFRLEQSPTLDGRILDDPAWAGVVPATGFWQVRPFEGRPASQRTEVFVGYTDDALYIGAVLYDDAPSRIIVTDSRRDSSLDDSDSFLVIVDTFHDGQNGFVFGTNPAGMEYDGQVTREGTAQFGSAGGGFNLEWDTSWTVRSAVTEVGWATEMRIPFRSLRYQEGETPVWGINFQRNIRRNNEVAYWSPLPRQYNLYRVSQAGTLEGLGLPQQRNLQIVPYLLGQARRGGPDLEGTDYGREAGVDVKYSLTPSLTLDLTVNTDFAQVEVDDVQVNLDRFSLFFPEKRPFFLENADQFRVGTPQELELFFSRRIGIAAGGAPQPIDAGARVSGRIGESTNVGALRMRTAAVDGVAPETDFSVARLNQELANRSALGAIFVERDSGSGDYNRVYAVDGRVGIGNDARLSGFVAKSETPGRRGDDHAYSLRADYNSTLWSNTVGFTQVGENFNPEVGFLRRRDYRKGEMVIFRRHRPDNLWGLHELRPHLVYRGFWGNDGFKESSFLHVDNHFEWRSGLEIHTGLNFVYEGVREPFTIVPGVVVEAGEYDEREAQLVLITNQGAPLSLSVNSRIGGFFGGDRVNLSPTLRYRFGEAFTSELSWNYNRIDLPTANGAATVNVGRLRLSYSFTPRVLLQALIQYDDRTDLLATNLRFAWLQSANAGLFLVYNEVDDETVRGPIEKRRELTLKWSRIFDVL
jgi:hypothetical protein